MIREIIYKLLENYCPDHFNSKRKEYTSRILAQIKEEIMEEIDKLLKIRFLTKNKLERQMSWIDGHKKAIEECKQVIEDLFR